jgi:two-component system CheB/CheR fusion protein
MSGAASETHRILRIFIVENHPDTLEGLSMYLRGLGHSIQAAHSMREALAALRTTEIDVLLSDIGLPDGDGWELLKQANLPKSVYAIAMSGFGMGNDHKKSRAAGYKRHLVKPFDPLELDQALDEAIETIPPGEMRSTE